MNSTLDFNFEHGINIVFEHMIRYRNFEKWNPVEGIYNVVNLDSNGAYSGFVTQFDIDGKVATIECQSLLYLENKEVRYRVIRSVFEDGTEISKGRLFPYSDMYQRLCFRGDENSCSVKYEVVLKPKNWLGWLTCKFCVIPQIVSVAKQSNQALNKYLTSI